MRSNLLSRTLLALCLTAAVGGVAAADTTAPAAAPAAGAAGNTKPAASPERQALLDELEKANTQLAQDKNAVLEARKGTDKAAVKTAQEKVKADGKAIHEIEMKLHALKGAKGKAAKGDAVKADAPPVAK